MKASADVLKQTCDIVINYAQSTLTDKDMLELLLEISSLSPWYVFDSFSTIIISSQKGIHDGNHDR